MQETYQPLPSCSLERMIQANQEVARNGGTHLPVTMLAAVYAIQGFGGIEQLAKVIGRDLRP